MTNPQRGELQVELGDQVLDARVTLDTIVRIERSLSMSILKCAQLLSTGELTIEQLQVILFRSLRSGGNRLEIKDIQKLIWDAGLADSYRVAGEILAMTLGTEEDDQGNEGAAETA